MTKLARHAALSFRARPRAGLLTLLAIGAVAAACSTPASGTSEKPSSPAPRAPASPAVVALTRNVHPLARPEFDVGRRNAVIPAGGSLYFKPSATQRAERDALVAAVQDPTSPRYHRWLGADEYARRFGVRSEDAARATAWLQSYGLRVDAPSRIGTRIGFHGTTGQVEAAFGTELHDYKIGAQAHYAMSKAPSIPADLAGIVLGIHGLHDFVARAPKLKKPDLAVGQGIILAPADLDALYDITPVHAAGTTGTGVNLVIVGQTSYPDTDIATFRSKLQPAITAPTITRVLVPGTGAEYTSSGDEPESELDLEWAGVTAPGANLVFVYTGSDYPNYTVDDAVAWAIEQGDALVPGVGNGAAQIISESYGGCEAGAPAENDLYGEVAAAANLQGITYLASSGDSGAAACVQFGIGGLYVGPPASMPGVTAVGGTEIPPLAQGSPFFTNGNVVEYPEINGSSLETPWNDSTAPAIPITSSQPGVAAAGGGASIIFSKPLYQVGVTPDDNARDLPDVSLTASNANLPYAVYIEGSSQLNAVGGTSAATPSFAGVVALLNQTVAAKGGALGLGNINPTLYGVASSTPAAFHDVVTGDNNVPCSPASDPDCPDSGTYGGYSAGPGYDLASGLGTVDVARLVAAWGAFTPTTTRLVVSSSTAAVGSPITLTARVASAATSNAIGGTVTFTFETFAGATGPAYAVDAGGGFDEAWVLGSVNVVPGTGALETGLATLVTAIPSGLFGKANVVAMYNGDTHYLASQSKTTVPITITGATLAIVPAAITLQPGQITNLEVTGGVPPVTWAQEGKDSTCLVSGSNEVCTFYESINPTTAALQAGGQAGTITIVAVDSQGTEAQARVTVAGTPIDGGQLPIVDDAGPLGGPVTAPPLEEGGVALDAGDDDGPDGSLPPTGATSAANGGSSGGCSVGATGSSHSNEPALGALVFGLAAVGRRRRRGR